MSNTFTQYLEFKLQQFCEIDNAMLLREVKYDDSNKKLDYLICGKSEAPRFFFEKRSATELDWRVCIEAQWGGNRPGKKETDFFDNDFPKLQRFMTTNEDQYKVALAHIEVHRDDVEIRFSEVIHHLSQRIHGGQKDKYLIGLSHLDRKNSLFTYAFYDNFVRIDHKKVHIV